MTLLLLVESFARNDEPELLAMMSRNFSTTSSIVLVGVFTCRDIFGHQGGEDGIGHRTMPLHIALVEDIVLKENPDRKHSH